MTNKPGEPLDINPAVFARYLSGEADRDECTKVEHWIAAGPEHRALAEAMGKVWDRPSPPEFDRDDTVWQALQRRIGGAAERPALVPADREQLQVDQVPTPRQPWLGRHSTLGARHRHRAWLAAAAAVVLFGATMTARSVLSKLTERSDIAVLGAREIATRRGEQIALRLADGTKVVLAAESRLRLADQFSGRSSGPRDVWLEGSALFEVVHDRVRPFRVHTAAAVAEDLGTEFVVTNYPETGGTRVVVASGVVALRRPSRRSDEPPSLTLGRRELGVMSTTGATTLERNVGLDPYLGWADGKLVFDGTPLREAVPALRRRYDIDLRLGNPALADKKLTGTFTDEPISQVLQLVAMSLDLTVEQRDGVITLDAPR